MIWGSRNFAATLTHLSNYFQDSLSVVTFFGSDEHSLCVVEESRNYEFHLILKVVDLRYIENVTWGGVRVAGVFKSVMVQYNSLSFINSQSLIHARQ